MFPQKSPPAGGLFLLGPGLLLLTLPEISIDANPIQFQMESAQVCFSARQMSKVKGLLPK